MTLFRNRSVNPDSAATPKRSSIVFAFVAIALGALSFQALGQVPAPGDLDEYGNHRVAGAQPEVPVPTAPMPEWGTATSNFLKLGSGSFTPFVSGYTYAQNFHWRWSTTGGPTYWDSSFHLPSGTMINWFTAEVYDNSATANISVWIATCPDLSPSCTYTPDVTTSGTPGYTWLNNMLASPITINNNMNSYHVRIFLGSGDNNTQFRSVAINYQLQVSPAPLTATFADVPTGNSQFKFVEALYAAGITAGCATGPPLLYCPNTAVTRGQMAVFLSLALGLHWPN